MLVDLRAQLACAVKINAAEQRSRGAFDEPESLHTIACLKLLSLLTVRSE